ncbi:putative HOOK N-terminal domain-containing protein [Seiridium unicorne]|uniref:HOOK N-terminal domain-containing protein n=1 Tax=Seiridium unicorne TaxID=138068 RepID=A0ABR2VHD9_9PEZI
MSQMKFSEEWQEALLDWARNIIAKDLNKSGPNTIEDLYNGAIFSDLLVILDDEYKPDELQENLSLASQDLPIEGRQRNMHIIRKALRSFVKRQLEVVEVLLDDVDFQALDRNPNNEGMCQILSIFLVISVNLPDKFISQEILQDMQRTPEDKARLASLMQIMNQSQNRIKQGDQAEPTDNFQAASSAPVEVAGMDELALEAELARLHREIESLKKRNADLVTVHERLQESHQELLDRHERVTSNRDKLQELLESGAYGDGAEKKKQLQEQNRLIDNLEMQLDDARRAKEELERVKIRLEAELGKLVPLAQEYQDLKQENEDLTKKANAAEHLKQKLEKLRGLESEVKKLREERNAFFEGQEQMMSFQKQVMALSAERDQQSRNMQAYEIQVSEFNAQKMAWNMEYQKLQRHLESMEIKSKDDEEMVRELQEKVMLLDPSAVTDSPYPARTESRSLEDELEGTTNETHTLKDLEISRLQTENALLKSSIGSEGDKGQLFQQIEREQDARKALQEKYNALFEKHTIERAALDSLTMKQENEAIATLRKQALAEESRANDLARQLEATQTELKDKERGLTEVQGDLRAIKDGQDALTELKNTDGLLAASLRAELESLRKKHGNLKYDFDSRQEQLVSALIDKDQLRKEVEAANVELQKAADGGQAVNPDVTKTMEKIEKLRVKYKQLSEQFDKSEVARRELEKTLKTLRAGSTEGEQDKTKEQIIKNLQRENAMISSAWYDLTSRLQSNHVVLQRRNDAPKSWLNKQRQLVNATPRR